MAPRRLRGVVVLSLLLALALGGRASAAVPSQSITPIRIGDGKDAFVTVDESGTAYIAFNGNESNFSSLHFCALPRGATACSVTGTIASDGSSNSLERPFLSVNGSTVLLLSYRYGLPAQFGQFAGDMLYTSTDGGATFGAPVLVGSNPFYFATPGPGNAVSTVTQAETGGMSYQRVPLDGTSAGSTRATFTDHGYQGSVALLDPNTPLLLRQDANDDTFWSRFTGGDPNDVNNWTAPTPAGARRYPRLVSGSAGLFMISGDETTREETATPYTGVSFGTSVTIPGGSGETPQASATQDGAGRMQVVLPQITANGSRLLYATSDNGQAWAARQLAFEPLAGNTYIAAASDHQGYAVWQSSASTTSVFATPIGPSANVPTTAKFVDVTVVSGTVAIQVPGSKKFVPLKTGDVIPVGSLVDATKGRVRVTIALPNKQLQSSDFFQGIFRVTQARSGLATMVLAGGSFGACGRAASVVQAAKSKKVIRQLWGSGKGKFQTKGRFATASVRGTTWDTVDRCDGTLVKVTQGRVLVTDLRKHRQLTVKAGQSYLAKA